MKHFDAVVTREGKWWMVSIPALDGLTQARRLSEAKFMARDYIALTLDIPIDDVEVTVSLDKVGSVTDISSAVESIDDERERAGELDRRATQRAIDLAKALAAESVPVRDIGTVLHVSHQRAHQLVKG